MMHIRFQSRLKLIVVAFVALLAMAACGTKDGGNAAAKKDGARPVVLATTLPLYDFARTVAGPDADVSLLPPPGVGPHSYMASLKDRERMEGADLIVANGLSLEEWLDDALVSHLESRGVKVVRTGEMIPLNELRPNGDFAWGADHLPMPVKPSKVMNSPKSELVSSASIRMVPQTATGAAGSGSAEVRPVARAKETVEAPPPPPVAKPKPSEHVHGPG